MGSITDHVQPSHVAATACTWRIDTCAAEAREAVEGLIRMWMSIAYLDGFVLAASRQSLVCCIKCA